MFSWEWGHSIMFHTDLPVYLDAFISAEVSPLQKIRLILYKSYTDLSTIVKEAPRA